MNLGRNAIVVVAVSLVLTLGSVFYINSQTSNDDGHGRERSIGGMMLTDGQRRLIRAIRAGSLEETQREIALEPGLAKDKIPGFGTALHVAAALNQPEITTFLLDKGADIRARGQWGGTPLHVAAWLGSRDTVALLIQRGADCEVRCESFNSTPLLWAAHGSANDVNPSGEYVEVCRLLVDAGAHADTSNKNGDAAVAMASPPVAHFLLEHGAKAPATTQPARSEPARTPAGQRA